MSGRGYIPEHKIDEVRQAADIVTVVGKRVRLTQKGKDWWGRCPFHGDTDPSFKVDRQRGTWYCFGCGEGGSAFTFLMKDLGLSFPESVRELAGQFGVDLPSPELGPAEKKAQEERDRLRKVLALARDYYREMLAGPQGSAARDYLARARGLSQETVREFEVGFAPDEWEGLGRFLAARGVPQDLAVMSGMVINRDSKPGAYDRFRGRVMFPIRDTGGRVISFGGRILGDGEPKYLNGPESPLFNKSAALFNLDKARTAMRKSGRALVVEGYLDAVTCFAHGFGESVAPMGTALTERQVRLLKRNAPETVLVFDGDEAGMRAAVRALPIFQQEDAVAKALLLPQGEDPDSFLRQRGAEAFAGALKGARPLVEVVLDRITGQGDTSTPEGRSQVAQEAGKVIKAIKDPMARWLYLKRQAKALGVPPEVMAARLGLPAPGSFRAKSPRPARTARPVRTGAAADSERGLLELALCSAEACRVLAEGGAFAMLGDPALSRVGEAITTVLARGGEPTASAVMDATGDQELAGLVTGLAQCDLELPPGEARREAEILLAKLDQQARQRKGRELDKAIEAAWADGDQERVDALMRRRQEVSQTNPSGTSGKD